MWWWFVELCDVDWDDFGRREAVREVGVGALGVECPAGVLSSWVATVSSVSCWNVDTVARLCRVDQSGRREAVRVVESFASVDGVES